MKLEQQLVCRELSEELKKNGYPQEGLWWWSYVYDKWIVRRTAIGGETYFVAPTEYWVNIPHTKGLYQISNFGQIKREGKIIKANISPNGYAYLDISIDNYRETIRPHRVMAKVFLPNPLSYTQVNHKNGNKIANWIENLEWCSPKQNMAHSYKQGTHQRDKRGKYKKCLKKEKLL